MKKLILICLVFCLVLSCEENPIEPKEVLLPDYSLLKPDETLKSFQLGLANSLMKREISKLEDEEVINAMEVQARKLSINEDKLHEATNTFKTYHVIKSSLFQKSRLNMDSYEYSEIQSDFLNEFNLRFSSSSSIEEYRASIELLLENFNNKDLQESDVIFITNFLVIMELGIEFISVIHENGRISNSSRTHCNWWCDTGRFFREVGYCGGEVLNQIARDAALSAATVVATVATGGTAAAYGLAGIAIGCTINVAIAW